MLANMILFCYCIVSYVNIGFSLEALFSFLYPLNWWNEHQLGRTPGDGEGQGGLECCSPWGHKESVMTQWMNNSRAGVTGPCPHGVSIYPSLSYHLTYDSQKPPCSRIWPLASFLSPSIAEGGLQDGPNGPHLLVVTLLWEVLSVSVGWPSPALLTSSRQQRV